MLNLLGWIILVVVTLVLLLLLWYQPGTAVLLLVLLALAWVLVPRLAPRGDIGLRLRRGQPVRSDGRARQRQDR